MCLLGFPLLCRWNSSLILIFFKPLVATFLHKCDGAQVHKPMVAIWDASWLENIGQRVRKTRKITNRTTKSSDASATWEKVVSVAAVSERDSASPNESENQLTVRDPLAIDRTLRYKQLIGQNLESTLQGKKDLCWHFCNKKNKTLQPIFLVFSIHPNFECDVGAGLMVLLYHWVEEVETNKVNLFIYIFTQCCRGNKERLLLHIYLHLFCTRQCAANL